MTAHFENVELINLSPVSARSGIDIYFERVATPPPPDAQVEELRRAYERAIRVLRSLDMPDNDFGTLVNQLVEGARVGLRGPNYSLESGRDQLDRVQADVVVWARSGRDQYLWQMLRTGGGVALLFFTLAVAAYLFPLSWLPGAQLKAKYPLVLQVVGPLLLLPIGVVLGVVFIAFVANRTLTFERVANFDPYQFKPFLRFVYVSVVGYVLFVALWFKFIMLGLGGYLLNDVKTDPFGGLLIGMVCGISEATIVELLLRLKPAARPN